MPAEYNKWLRILTKICKGKNTCSKSQVMMIDTDFFYNKFY